MSSHVEVLIVQLCPKILELQGSECRGEAKGEAELWEGFSEGGYSS